MIGNLFVRFSMLLALTSLTVGCHSVLEGSTEPENFVAVLNDAVEIIDPRAKAFISESTQVRVHARDYVWTEGPLWIEEEGYLLFSDIPNNLVYKYQPGVGISRYLERSGSATWREGEYPAGSNGLLLNPQGQLVLFQQGDRRIASMNRSLKEPAAEFTTLVDNYGGLRLNSPNDGAFHSNGNLYFTDPPYGLENGLDDAGKELSFQGVYRLSPSGEISLLDDSVRFPNGIGLSADEKALYVAVSDEDEPVWLVYDLDADGAIENKRVFHAVSEDESDPGLPDGMAVHSSGNIFATGPGGVWLFSQEGELLARIRTGRLTANSTLSADEKVLYITAQDSLMSVLLK